MNAKNIITQNRKFICTECKNEIEMSKDSEIGDVIECNFCGIEYEIVNITHNGEFIVQIIEEEK